MSETRLPSGLVEARRTPLFDFESLPDQLAESHRTTVWAQLFVQSGTVHYTDLEGENPRDVGLGSDDAAVIEPGIEHRVEPATDATFFIQFYRAPDEPIVPGTVPTAPPLRSGPWVHDTVDDGWTGPHAEHAKKRATGTAWAMAQRFLGKGTWRPAQHR